MWFQRKKQQQKAGDVEPAKDQGEAQKPKAKRGAGGKFVKSDGGQA